MLPFISVHLQVLAWTRLVAVGGDAHDILRFSAKLIDRDEFRTPKSELRDLTAMPWDIELTCDGWASPLGGIGVASHHPEWQSDDHFSPERFWINATTTPGQFRQVLERLQEWPGHQLVASFDLDGLVYGWEPDGSSVEWDLSTPNLPIQKASFILKPVTDEERIDETPAVLNAARLSYKLA